MIDESYIPFANTDRQREIISAIIERGSQRKAAEALGCSKSTISSAIAPIVYRYKEHHGLAAPDGYFVKGTSTLYDDSGSKKMQWVKTNVSAEAQAEIMRAVVDAMKDEVEPCEPELPLTVELDTDKVNMFLITDYHLGMRSWPEETNNDAWDIKIAEEMLVKWFAAAIRSAPQAHTAIFANLGDFLHWDGLDAVTPMHGNILEGDTRKDKLVETAIRVIRRVVKMLLATHNHVHLLMAEGNHDLDGSAWLRQMFAALYDNEPRVTVDTSPQPYYCYEHGKTSLYFHHGHKRKVNSLDSVFAAKFRETYGRTKHAYGHTGHLHGDRLVETNLMTIEQHRTLCSPDSFSTRGGWVSGRSAKVITYHKEHGEVGRVSITPEMAA